MISSELQLRKWYCDCVTDRGELAIGYVARLSWRGLSLGYASILTCDGDAPPQSKTVMNVDRDPMLDGDLLRWRHDQLGVDGWWQRQCAGQETTLITTRQGDIHWRPLIPRAAANMRIGDRTLAGHGYAEELEMTLPPWKLPVDELRWGRFIGGNVGLTWIEWRGEILKILILRDGADVAAEAIDDARILYSGGALTLSDRRTIRSGPLISTALAAVPGVLMLFPQRITHAHETKWISRGTLTETSGQTCTGWAIHEVMRFTPPSEKTS